MVCALTLGPPRHQSAPSEHASVPVSALQLQVLIVPSYALAQGLQPSMVSEQVARRGKVACCRYQRVHVCMCVGAGSQGDEQHGGQPDTNAVTCRGSRYGLPDTNCTTVKHLRSNKVSACYHHHHRFLQQVHRAYSTSLARRHHETHQTNLVCPQLWHTRKPGPECLWGVVMQHAWCASVYSLVDGSPE
jgi:hypothetical protein